MSDARQSQAATERVTLGSLSWITVCMTLTLAPSVAALPVWVTVTIAAVAALRLVLAAQRHAAPTRGVRYVITFAAIGLLFLQYRTFNGLSAGTALLSLIAGLKLMETETRRDIYAITLILYFLSLSTLLQGDSLWQLGYFIGVCWLITSTLLRLTHIPRAGGTSVSLRQAGRILVQALPIAAVFWLFFPRFGGPLWQVADRGNLASSGLGDSMSPGDITDLALSDEVAFRVRFARDSATPPPAERYWRGPVLHDFDGRAWRRTDSGPVGATRLEYLGPAYRYTVSLEPNQHNWLFVLDWPSQWDAPRALLTGDYMLVDSNPGPQPLDVTATSFGRTRATEPLSKSMRSRDLVLPLGSNPRSLRLSRDLRAAHPDDSAYIDAVLALFHDQPFFYTLHPPPLNGDSVDEFLFDSRRGFCGHFASAFAILMRAAGLPARVVTGYQGGTYNRFANYWIMRQSDAHAWNEVWLEGRGWVRVDPTAAIAPERVEIGLNAFSESGAAATSRWQRRRPWLSDTRLRLDALRLLWRERILRFDQSSQERLLTLMHIPEPDGRKVALVLAVGLVIGMAWLTWTVRRELTSTPSDPVTRAYARLCRRLSAVGIERRPAEGAESYAARVAGRRPDLAATVQELCRLYSELRYGAAPQGERRSAGSGARIAAFVGAVRAFRPRDSRASF